jgi:hypothetical protein
MNGDFPPLIVRVLLNIYTGQQIRVLWNGIYSNSFYVSNGAKQSAILSPLLFCAYYDNLLLALRSKGVGCRIGGLFFGALAYADDVVLSPHPPTQCVRCFQCAIGIQLNLIYRLTQLSRSVYFFVPVICGAAHLFKVCHFIVGGKDIEFVNKWSHLGHIINDRL